MVISDQERENILGVMINPINLSDSVEAIVGWIRKREPNYMCLVPAHSVMSCVDNPKLRPVFNRSGVSVPDGMAIVWILQSKGHKHVSRVYGPDLLLALCERSQKEGFRHYFYGGALGLPEKLTSTLQEKFPGLAIAGQESPPYRDLTDQEDMEMTERIRSVNPNIVWVGVGSPRQEVWMQQHNGKLGDAVLVGVGAAFDFVSGSKPQAPVWMQRGGLEWFFRLLSEPGRLWKRYLVNYPRFAVLLVLQNLGIMKYSK